MRGPGGARERSRTPCRTFGIEYTVTLGIFRSPAKYGVLRDAQTQRKEEIPFVKDHSCSLTHMRQSWDRGGCSARRPQRAGEPRRAMESKSVGDSTHTWRATSQHSPHPQLGDDACGDLICRRLNLQKSSALQN